MLSADSTKFDFNAQEPSCEKHGKRNAFYVFKAASLLDDVETRYLAISIGGDGYWDTRRYSDFDLDKSIIQQKAFDLRNAPFQEYDELPPQYAHAILRATCQFGEIG